MAEDREELERRETESPETESAEEDEGSKSPEVLPLEAEEALKKVIESGGAKALLSVSAAFSRTSLGPDPQTAKILAEVEKHSEESRLKGYQATLEQRDKQEQRDHEFRNKQLNHNTVVTCTILLVAVGGIVIGPYLTISGQTQIGGYILVASLMALLQAFGRQLPSLQ
jgi:Flp pilus assembly protein TadB